MTKITLPKELTLKDSPFFEQILQASTRGDVLVWNEDYSKATLTLSTDTFFTDKDAKAIIEKGGEVEGYPYWIKMSKSEFESKQIPEDLTNYLNNNNNNNKTEQLDSEIEVQTIKENFPTYKESFNFVKNDKEDDNYIYFLNSTNSEYLPMSLTIKL